MVAPARHPQQARSRQAFDRIVAAARELSETRDFDSISVRELARAAGCSVGSFHYRFGTKEDFFRFLVEDMIRRREAEAEETFATTPIADLPAALARGAVANYRRYGGFLRSVIKRHLEGKADWQPISQMGGRYSARFMACVEEARGRPLSEAQRERVRFSFVWLYGLLSQSVIGLSISLGMERAYFEREAVRSFEQAITAAIGEEG
ncbi:MAG: TetR/AcrR family transcriptional regulator [Sphingomonas fennica]